MLNKHPEKSWELAMAKTTKTDDHGLVLDVIGTRQMIMGWYWMLLVLCGHPRLCLLDRNSH